MTARKAKRMASRINQVIKNDENIESLESLDQDKIRSIVSEATKNIN